LFGKNKKQRTISLNCNYIVLYVLLKNPRYGSQFTTLNKQIYLGKTVYVQKSFKDARANPHDYMLVDIKQETLDNLRLRSMIFPDYTQVVYVPE
jgi:hypothetical protein